MALQTKEEMQRIFISWADKHMPSNLANTVGNAKALAEHCFETYNFISIANLNASVADLAGQLGLVPTKSQDEIAKEFQERERKRIAEEAKANAVPFDIAARTREAEALQALEKAQENAKTTRGHLLATWCVNGLPGRVDGARTAEGIEILSGINIRRGTKTDYVLTLRAVQKLFHCETPEQIANQKDGVIQQVINEAKGIVDPNIAKAERQRQRAEERRVITGATNLPRYS